jgi:hypothetical protein
MPRVLKDDIVVPERTAHSREIVYLCTELLARLSTWFDFGGLTVERVEGQVRSELATDAVAMCA